MLPDKPMQTLTLSASSPGIPAAQDRQEWLRAPRQLSSHHFQPGTSRYNPPWSTDANLCSKAEKPELLLALLSPSRHLGALSVCSGAHSWGKELQSLAQALTWRSAITYRYLWSMEKAMSRSTGLPSLNTVSTSYWIPPWGGPSARICKEHTRIRAGAHSSQTPAFLRGMRAR